MYIKVAAEIKILEISGFQVLWANWTCDLMDMD